MQSICLYSVIKSTICVLPRARVFFFNRERYSPISYIILLDGKRNGFSSYRVTSSKINVRGAHVYIQKPFFSTRNRRVKRNFANHNVYDKYFHRSLCQHTSRVKYYRYITWELTNYSLRYIIYLSRDSNNKKYVFAPFVLSRCHDSC